MNTSGLENSAGSTTEETVCRLFGMSFLFLPDTFFSTLLWANYLCELKTPDSGQLFKRINISHSKEIDTQF